MNNDNNSRNAVNDKMAAAAHCLKSRSSRNQTVHIVELNNNQLTLESYSLSSTELDERVHGLY
uniref:DUF1869 domain-containing protein n=1 Tax=Syphacia muris TaxID=451379 RepID=A0A158R644_9BILA